METIAGYLFEKKKITRQSQEFEFVKVVDYVAALMFKNNEKEWAYSIISGDYIGELVYDDEDYEIYEGLYISQAESIDDVIYQNNDIVDLAQIRKDKLSCHPRFYRVMTNFDGEPHLCAVEDKDLIEFLEKNWDSDEQTEYNPVYSHTPKSLT